MRKRILLFYLLFQGAMIPAFSQCTNCTYTQDDFDGNTFTLTGNEVLCITNNININFNLFLYDNSLMIVCGKINFAGMFDSLVVENQARIRLFDEIKATGNQAKFIFRDTSRLDIFDCNNIELMGNNAALICLDSAKVGAYDCGGTDCGPNYVPVVLSGANSSTTCGCNPEPDFLPVELQYFHVEEAQPHYSFRWSTLTEQNNEGFFLEFSEDGKRFESFTFIEGSGNSEKPIEYKWLEPINNFNGKTIYFRLKQVDFSGTYVYSDVVSLKLPESQYDIQIYPTLFSDELMLSGSSETEIINIELFDAMGRRVYLAPFTGNNRLYLGDVGLKDGLYFISLRLLNGGRICQKVIKMP